MIEKDFNPNLLYNRIVHYYIDKKGYSKQKANEIAQLVVIRELRKRICKNLRCHHLRHQHIRSKDTCLVVDCECTEFRN